MNSAIIAQGREFALRAESEVVDVGELYRQFTNRESARQHVDIGVITSAGIANEQRGQRGKKNAAHAKSIR
jgi:hypothetical protein